MPSATSTLATIGSAIIGTVVELATVVFTTYWPYILVFAVLTGLVIAATRFLHFGHR